jgi:hypothetical protein
MVKSQHTEIGRVGIVTNSENCPAMEVSALEGEELPSLSGVKRRMIGHCSEWGKWISRVPGCRRQATCPT